MWLLWIFIVVMMLAVAAIILVPLWRSSQLPWFSTVFVLLAVPLISIPLYLHWGDSKDLSTWVVAQQHQQDIKKFMTQFKNPQQVIDRLKLRLAQQPDSAQGWYLLGRIYFTSGKIELATDAFSKANRLKPNDSTIMLQYAQAMYFNNKQSLNKEATQLLNQVLAKQKNNPMAINLLAVNAYQHKQYQQAVNYWEKLLPLFPPQSKNAEVVLTAIAKAQQHIKPTLTKKSVAANKIKLLVSVKLNPALRKQLQANDVLFVYAKAVNGPSMPVAIKRLSAKDLPLQTVLSDASTMLPSIHLSQFSKVRVFARISHTGTAIPQTGDFIGESKVLNLSKGETRLELNIDKTV